MKASRKKLMYGPQALAMPLTALPSSQPSSGIRPWKKPKYAAAVAACLSL